MTLDIDGSIPIGVYYVNLNLIDDNLSQPKEAIYTVTIIISEDDYEDASDFEFGLFD